MLKTDTIDYVSCRMGMHAHCLFTSIPTDSRSNTMPKYFISTFKSPNISAHCTSCLTTSMSPIPLTDFTNKPPSQIETSPSDLLPILTKITDELTSLSSKVNLLGNPSSSLLPAYFSILKSNLSIPQTDNDTQYAKPTVTPTTPSDVIEHLLRNVILNL